MFTVKDLKEKIAELEDIMPVCFLDFDDDEISYMRPGQTNVGNMYIYKIGNNTVFSQYEDVFDIKSKVQKVFYITQG